jgi:hypothetical protein
MAAIKERANTSVTSSNSSPTSLEDYIRVYNKAGMDCYTDYMQGAKLLYKFLSPIEIPQLKPIEVPQPAPRKISRKMPRKTPKMRRRHKIYKTHEVHKIPALFHGYEVQRLAVIIAGEAYGDKYQHIESLILYYTAKHILEGVTL